MSKLHITLRLSTNVVLVIVWGLFTVLFAIISDPLPVLPIAAGGTLGALGGYMQYLSFKEGREKFLQAKTFREVKAKFKETSWGKRYTYFMWLAVSILVVISLLTSNISPLAYFSSCFGLMFVREIVTLNAILDLSRMQPRSLG